MNGFRVTYDVVTPESAENGDFAEIGYAAPGGWRFPLIHGEEREAPPVATLHEDARKRDAARIRGSLARHNRC